MSDKMERVARHLLLSSPPGQFDLVLSDLKVLIPSSVLSPAFCADVLSEYESRSGSSLLSSSSKDDRMESEFGTMLQSKINEFYITSHFHNNNDHDHGVVAKSQVVPQDSKNKFKVSIYAQRVNLKNYHAGSWKTVFEVETSNSTAHLMNAQSTVRAHTFENGNVQLSYKIQIPSSTVTVSDSDHNNNTLNETLVDKIIQELENWDREHILQPIHEIYDTMSEKTLKSLRRIMPVTRTKFDWNLARHRFVNTLSNDVVVGRK